jgi:hypothetical protein
MTDISPTCATQDSEDSLIKVLDLKIGEENAYAQSLILLELEDTQRSEFRGRTTRRASIQRIFGKIKTRKVSQVDKTQLKGLPRRSLLSAASDVSWLRRDQESDDDTPEESTDDQSARMLDLKIGEQDPTTNSLVVLEMQDANKTGFTQKCTRKKSINRIFGKIPKAHYVHDFDRSKLAGIPRRSLASGLDLIKLGEGNESDDEEPPVQVFDLKIGETAPAGQSLVALEMQDTKKSGFRSQAKRKESVGRIFGKLHTVSVARGVDERKLSGLPRRSVAGGFELAMLQAPSESDESD